MSEKDAIAARLRGWGLEKFGSLKAFAEALGMSQESLSQYVNGKSLPGNKVQGRLRLLNCDIVWLMTGETQEEIRKKFDDSRVGRAMKLRDEDFDIVEYLHTLGLDTLEKVKAFCSPEAIAEDVAMVLRKRKLKYQTNRIKKK